MSHFRKPMILTAVLLGLVGVAYLDDWQTKQEERAEESRLKVVPIDVSKVTAIALESDLETASVRVSKKDGAWVISEPMTNDADKDTIENLLSTLTDYKFEKIVATDLSRKSEFGLDDPVRRIHLFSGDERFTLDIGEKAPLGYSVYFSDGQKIMIGSQYLLTSTAKTLHDFRSKKIVAIDPTELKQVSYLRDNRLLVSYHRGEGETLVDVPKDIPIDLKTVDQLIAELNKAKAQEFASVRGEKALQGWSTAAESFELRWEYQQGNQHYLAARKVGGRPWVQVDGGEDLFAVTDEFWAATYRTLPDFRNRKLISVSTEEIANVEIDGEVYQQRSDGRYYDSNGEQQAHIKDFVFDVAYAKVEHFLDDKSAISQITKSAPESKIKFDYKDASDVKSLELSLFKNADDASKYYVAVSDRQGLVTITKRIFDKRMAPSRAENELDMTAKSDGDDNG